MPSSSRLAALFDGQLSGYLIVGFATLVVGFFAGRWYLKYEVTSAMNSAAEKISGATSGLAHLGAPADAPKPAAPKPEAKPAFNASLVAKDFREADYSGGTAIHAANTFTITFENLTGKDIRAFEGKLVFTDLFDNVISSIGGVISHPVAAGETMTWKGEARYNQFDADDQRLRSAALQNLKFRFITSKLLFADGTIEER